jgi:nucleoside-diphosphate-sugar epimerase
MGHPLPRRAFLTSSLAAAVSAAPVKKKILILGGTGFLGPATVAAAQARGHQLTLFNRGRTRPGLFPDIETLLGDRDPDKDQGLKALAGRQWDVVIDNSAYFHRGGDVRDLGAWLISLAENRTLGTFNAAGPRHRLRWGDLLASCRRASSSKSNLVWAGAEWIAKQGEELFPIWAPYQGQTRGFHLWSNRRAVLAGLTFRPHQETAKDTLAWYKTQPENGRTKLAGPTPEKEAALLAAWRQR